MNDAAQFLISHGGAVLFAFVFIEEAGLPLPAAPWLLAAGALWAGGQLNPLTSIGLAALASILADSVWFYIGRGSGPRILRLFCRLSLAKNSCVGRSRHLFERHGLQALMAAKFLPGLGTVMPPLAGAMGMSTRRFLLFDGLGSLVYGASYVVVGFLFHNQVQQALALLNHLGLSALVLGLALAAGYISFKYVRRRKAQSRGLRLGGTPAGVAEGAMEEASELPLGGFGGAAAVSAAGGMGLAIQPVALVSASSAPQRVAGAAVLQACDA